MIFAKTINLVLSGRKSQTLRLAYAGDRISETKIGEKCVLAARGQSRWIVGHYRAVQRERCHKGEGHILITGLREVLNPLEVSDEFASAEGFDSKADYLRIWHELHGKNPIQRCWAISFRLAEKCIEIVGPDKKVHYRRPVGHPMVKEAQLTLGYARGDREGYGAGLR